MKGKEGAIQDAVMDILLRHPRVAFAYVNTSGKIKGRGGHWMTLGFPGLADITGMLKGGRFFAIEVKQPGKEPTEAQQEFLDAIVSGGGVAGWVDAPEQALDILDAERMEAEV